MAVFGERPETPGEPPLALGLALYNASVPALGRAVIAGSLAATLAVSAQESASPIDRAFRTFWSAPHAASAAERIDPILKTGVSFEDALTRVRHGRAYEADVPRGLQFGRHRTFDGIDHEYAFVIPKDYDPSRPYQVRFQLHGGIARARPPVVNRIRVDALPSGVEEIAVFPGGWVQSLWWSATQVDNLARILDRLKRTYNIDENRVYLTGTSDGGTGVYYMAFRDPTPWASFLPLIGDMMVLGTPAVRAEGEIYPGNAVNKPFYVVNTGRDPPVSSARGGAVCRSSAEARRPRGVPCRIRSWTIRQSGGRTSARVRVVRARSSARAVARRDLVADRAGRSIQPRALADHRSAWIGRGREPAARHATCCGAGASSISACGSTRPSIAAVARTRSWRARTPSASACGPAIASSRSTATTVETGRDIAEEMARWEAGRSPSGSWSSATAIAWCWKGRSSPTEVEVPPTPIFPRRKPSGRVDLVRRGNVVEASTEGVRAFTLLLSPSIFDFRRPITVVANGRTAFEGMVEPSVATLLKWAARDNDRTMVFGAELNIELAKVILNRRVRTDS